MVTRELHQSEAGGAGCIKLARLLVENDNATPHGVVDLSPATMRRLRASLDAIRAQLGERR